MINQAQIQPLCPVFLECGGCLYQDRLYADELKTKENDLQSMLDQEQVKVEKLKPIVSSPKEYHYRHRLDLKLYKQKDQRVLIGFSQVGRNRVVPVDQCAIAEEYIDAFIPSVKAEALAALPQKYRNANLVVRTGEEGKVYWGGIGRRSLRMLPADYLYATINGRKVFYALDTFFQANLSILPKLFEVLTALPIWDEGVELYDLYGGVGLFSIGLIDRVKRSILIEDSKNSIQLAQYNCSYHKLENMEIIQGRVEDELAKVMENQNSGQDVRVAMIDPPRAGLAPSALKIFQSGAFFKYIIYLSCNPETLVRDLKELTAGCWQIQSIQPFDFFPKTKHLEVLTVLERTGKGF